MVSFKEFRLGAILELIGMVLALIYFTNDMPYVSIYANIMGETVHAGTLNIQTIGITGINFIFIVFLILGLVSTIIKLIAWHKPTVIVLHRFSVFFLILCPFYFILIPFLLGIRFHMEKEYAFAVPHICCVLLGVYNAIVGCYSRNRFFRCYGEHPKTVRRLVWPVYTKTWLEYYYGNNTKDTVNTDNIESENGDAKMPEEKHDDVMTKPLSIKDNPFLRLIFFIIILPVIVGFVISQFFLIYYLKDHTTEIDIPAVHETIYRGNIGKSKVEMKLTQIGDSLSGEYFYTKVKKPIKIGGKIEEINDLPTYMIDEYVDGKKTGTFKLNKWEYDGELSLEGKWSNEKRTFNVSLPETISRILPSQDLDNPFVGEWETAEGAKAWAFVQLGLYNKDIDGEYAHIRMPLEQVSYQFSVDSVLRLEGHDAELLVTYGTESQRFLLHYTPSDQSLRIETEKWGTYNLYMDHRNLQERLKTLEKTEKEAEENTLLLDYPTADTYELIEDVPLVEEIPNEQVEQPEIVQDQLLEDSIEEAKKAEEKARLKEELEKELEKEQQEKAAEEESADDSNKIYDKVEINAEYPGGTYALHKFISKNVRYPSVSKELGIQGRVVVSFTIDTDGSVIDAKITESVDENIDQEALRVINLMPKWKPGMQNGKEVKVSRVLPINFKL